MDRRILNLTAGLLANHHISSGRPANKIERPLSIVIMTNKSSHAKAILEHLKKNEIPIRSTVIERRREGYHNLSKKNDFIKRLIRLAKSEGLIGSFSLLVQVLGQTIHIGREQDWQNDSFYRNYSSEIEVVDDFNGTVCEEYLKHIKPDLIVLGGSRILRKNIIEIPRIGILNAHPGLLPEYRGVDVIRWAILNGEDVGVTVHFIDEEIDGGIICLQEVISINFGKDSIQDISIRSEELAGRLMAASVMMIAAHGRIEKSEIQKTGHIYHSMDRKKRKKVDRILERSARI